MWSSTSADCMFQQTQPGQKKIHLHISQINLDPHSASGFWCGSFQDPPFVFVIWGQSGTGISYFTSQPYLACSSESRAGICAHVDTTCKAENIARTPTGGGKGCYLGKIWTSRWWQLTYVSMFHPDPWGKWSSLTSIFFNWVETTDQLKKWSIITKPDSFLKETKFLIIIAAFFGNHQNCRLVENSRYFFCFGQRFRMFHSIRGDGAWVALSPP